MHKQLGVGAYLNTVIEVVSELKPKSAYTNMTLRQWHNKLSAPRRPRIGIFLTQLAINSHPGLL
jgi:hypothetical protein